MPKTIYFAGALFDQKHLTGNALLAQAIEQRHQREAFGGRDEFSCLAVDVLLDNQIFDDLSACRWGAKASASHGRTQILIINHFACAFHC